jgi:hypothetical protein
MVWSLDVSPDGKRLVFFDDSSKAEMSVLKNLFPAARASHGRIGAGAAALR